MKPNRNLAPPESSESSQGDREATAAYIAAMTAELSAMARKRGLEPLAYLLDMARLEAEGNHRGSSVR
jgi:hypothetical protein